MPNAPVATITHRAWMFCPLEVFNKYVLSFFRSDVTPTPSWTGELKYFA